MSERSGSSPAKVAAGSAALAGLAGFAVSMWSGAAPAGRMLPWIVGRGLGIAAYLSMTALVAWGLWVRHPAAQRWHWPAPATRIRTHAVLASTTIMLVLGHIAALVVDSFARVGVLGAIIPGASGYRPLAVALGTISFYLAIIMGGSAALAGRLTGRLWWSIHRVALLVFGLAWAHGLLAGSDAPRLRLMYAVTGAGVTLLALTKRLMPMQTPFPERRAA